MRALAVLPVVLFHAGIELFSGGFIGVDIFFVISGYLITGLLINDLETNQFSYLDFYDRRARRILPALCFVMLCCIPFAWMWMLPAQLEEFSASLIATSFFVSNIFFWKQSGYFADSAEEKPLLHTWSLAVEEQYYILFPIVLFVLFRYFQRDLARVFIALALIALVSFFVAEFGWRVSPSANFYLSPGRVWELLAGSAAAIILRIGGQRDNELLSASGLLLVFVALVTYDEATPFPSVYSLVPVIGVVLIICFGGQSTFTGKFLSGRILVGVGLISYSVYLWHQPLFAFARLRLHQPSVSIFLTLSLLSVVLGYLSWRFVEKPFRKRSTSLGESKRVLIGSGVALSAISVLGIFGLVGGGFPSRIGENVNQVYKFAQPVSPSCGGKKFNQCAYGNDTDSSSFAIIGDSHAGRYTYSLERIALERGVAFQSVTGAFCAPLVNWRASSVAPNPACFPAMEKTLRELATSDIEVIVLAAQWGNYTQGFRHGSAKTAYQYTGPRANQDASDFANAFYDTIAMFKEAGKRVLLVEPTPEYEFSVPKALAKSMMFRLGVPRASLELSIGHYQERTVEFFDALYYVGVDAGQVFSSAKYFCDMKSCRPYSSDGLPLYNDGNHLNQLGLQLLEEDLFLFIQDQFND